VKILDEAVFEDVAVEKILDKRTDGKGVTEFLVKWSDGSEDSWEPAVNIGEDLVKDYEEGLEYGIAERILEKRYVEGEGKPEYLVQWADSPENTWEPAENIADEIIAEFESQQNGSSKS
jgi:signal recognition particle protein